MSWLTQIEQEPWRFNFYDVMRRMERNHPDKPRIGESTTRREDYALLGQNPYLDFPASNLAEFRQLAPDKYRIMVKFLGLLGPQGALPLATTEEAFSWLLARDDAFPRFLDIFNHRFLQLFFRVWADARPIAQHDRPKEDRFLTYIGSVAGLGSEIFRNQGCVPDAAKLAYAGIMGGKAKSASRLRQIIRGILGVKCEIDEFVGIWLALDKADCSRIGTSQARLGVDLMMGGSFYSVEDKIRIRIFVADMEEYQLFLPGQQRCEELADLVGFYLGEEIDWEVELAIPVGAVVPMKLGSAGKLGWTGWLSSNWSSEEKYRCDARFHPTERRRKAPQPVPAPAKRPAKISKAR